MEFLLLTKSTAVLIGPIANLLGVIMDWIFQACDLVGIANIGLSIVLFTLIVRLLMLPMTIKQQKYSKLNAVMQPEIQAITKKYKNKKDQESMMKMNEETRAVYDKYGTSPTGGCLQLIIQMPILFALYRVIINVPAYVPKLKDMYLEIVHVLQGIKDYNVNEQMIELAKQQGYAGVSNADELLNSDKIVDVLYQFDADEWNKFEQIFNDPNLTNTVNQYVPIIDKMNNFLGVPLASTPGFGFPGILIPIMAGLFQWLSTKMMTTVQPANSEDPTAKTMQTMNIIMPLVSVFFCFTMPAGLGLYWVAGSVVQIIMQWFINRYFNQVDVNEIIEKNLEKQNKKRAKKGLPPKKLNQVTQKTVRNLQDAAEMESQSKDKAAKREEQIKKSTEYYSSNNPKPGSLAAKANMVKQYNEKHDKSKK